MNIVIQLGLLAAGFYMLAKGSDLFVDGAAGIAARLRIPQIIVGLTIVAMGTSLPEASVSIAAAAKGSAAISIGNVLGSNIMNILLILGLTAIVCSIPIEKATMFVDIPFLTAISLLLSVVCISTGMLTRREGFIMWVIFIAYLIYLIKRAGSSRSEGEAVDSQDEGSSGQRSIPLLLMLIAGGSLLIIAGSNVSVDAATSLAHIFGISERIIGLTIVAFGTSLPELFTSVTAARKGDTGIAVGNIVGSNIFNILFVLGTSSLILDIPFDPEFTDDSIISVAVCVILWAASRMGYRLSRAGGLLLLACYGAYFASLMR